MFGWLLTYVNSNESKCTKKIDAVVCKIVY